jgi:hypothetical protein
MVKAKDLKKSSHSIILQGKEYKLAFDMNAIGLLEEFYSDVTVGLEEVMNGTVKSSQVLLWSMINSGLEEDEFMTLKQVGSLVEYKDFQPTMKQVVDVFIESMKSDEQEVKTKKTP